ncbi:hypothetical protein EMPS_10669 [Entomortierella parvispora]|uniref:Uncharacterized protein n=1 Tax=Entomortierella parvispora TaxID=205924 RepID=A0A9P3M1R9_9FUNG|nr:hypothetical protein EMPS_10669 [Entomortierella parvispora]
MPNPKFVKLAKRLSVDYISCISDISPDDILLAKENRETYPSLFYFAISCGWNRTAMTLFEWISMPTGGFPKEEDCRTPIDVNGLVLRMLIIDDIREKKICTKFLRNINIPSINAILDEHFPKILMSFGMLYHGG